MGAMRGNLSTRIREHFSLEKSSHIYNYLSHFEFRGVSCSPYCFEIIDSASTTFQFQLKEALHIRWAKPSLKQQVKHVN